MDILLLVIGLAGLWLGTELTIRGAITITERFGISELVVGIAFLSIGSDLPELAVAIDAAIKILQLQPASDVVVGSALGSCLAQIGLVLGLAALFTNLTLPRTSVYRQGSVLLGSAVLLGLFGLDGSISRAEGLSLVTVYVIYFVTVVTDSMNHVAEKATASFSSLAGAVFFVLVGLGIVTASAELTVSAVSRVAIALNIEQALVAIIAIGLGSSLPELSISVGAVMKRRIHLSVGNLIGSNVFDTLVPIGVAATISEISFDPGMLRFELPFLFILSVTVLLLFLRSGGIQKRQGMIIMGAYCGYLLLKIATA